MKILLGDKSNLEELFAEIEITRIRKQLREAQQTIGKVPTKIKQIISETDYPEKMADLIRKAV